MQRMRSHKEREERDSISRVYPLSLCFSDQDGTLRIPADCFALLLLLLVNLRLPLGTYKNQPLLAAWISCSHTIPQTRRGKLSHFRAECLFCLIQAVDVDFDDPLLSDDDDDGFQFECLRKSNGQASGISSEIPFQVDLPREFVDAHATELQSGLSTVCVRGGTIDFPNATVPGQVVIPEGADLELIAGGQETDEDEGLGFGNRTVLVVRVLGTGESPIESLEEMQGAVFGVGRQPWRTQ